MKLGEDLNWESMDLEELISRGRGQTGNLTFYKLVFNSFDQLARENAGDDEVYRRSLLALVSGFLSVVRPEFLPQAVAAKNLLVKKVAF